MAQNWFQHTLSRKRFYARNQAALLAILGTAILLVLGSIYLSQVASFAITNRTIEDLIIQRDELKYTNEQLIAEIARFRTVPRLTLRAQDIGFRPATNDEIDYVVIEGYSPTRRNSFAEAASARANKDQAPVYDETFSGWIQRQLATLREQIEAFGS
ncbi:MAG: hypothetical protein OXE52_18075 [Chloroflexi bacterium]|nr:hypothetical protein [Chloroflexota bacterium]